MLQLSCVRDYKGILLLIIPTLSYRDSFTESHRMRDSDRASARGLYVQGFRGFQIGFPQQSVNPKPVYLFYH